MQAAIDRVLRTLSFQHPSVPGTRETDADTASAQSIALAARLLGNYTAHLARRDLQPN